PAQKRRAANPREHLAPELDFWMLVKPEQRFLAAGGRYFRYSRQPNRRTMLVPGVRQVLRLERIRRWFWRVQAFGLDKVRRTLFNSRIRTRIRIERRVAAIRRDLPQL